MNAGKLKEAIGPGLWSKGEAIPLQSVDVLVELSLPIAVTRQQQQYLNTLKTNIEARYVFPVPFDAVLLGLEIHIGERTLQGIVKAKNTAEREYEQAIVQGDSAFLLTKLYEGMYQISLGNILPQESVCLTITWAETMRWDNKTIRYRLPNLIGQHYGDPQIAGIEPANAPTHSGLAAYELSLTAKLMGDLQHAFITSPTHIIETLIGSEDTTVRFILDAWLDRSLTLTMTLPEPPTLTAWSAPDLNSTAVLACLYLATPAAEPKPHHLTLLIDGSGSMSGLPIEQARVAAKEIIHHLNDGDSCSIAAFGSNTDLLTSEPLQVGQHRARLLDLCERLTASLGGTEMLRALDRIMPITPEGGDILMVTDGQLYTSENDISYFARNGRRLFTVGVGHSTSEKVLRELSDASGGFCELVNPNENMADHIVSHFRRIRAPRTTPIVHWSGPVQRQHVPSVVFAGDTATIVARMAEGPINTLRVDTAGASMIADVLPAQGLLSKLLPRIVAAGLLPSDNVKLARTEAVTYQLITEHTSMVAVLERETCDWSLDLPEVIDVPQMDAFNRLMDYPKYKRLEENSQVFASYDLPAFSRNGSNQGSESASSPLTIPAFLRRQSDYGPAVSDDNWLDDINLRIKSGYRLEGLLKITELPTRWQSVLQPLLSNWAEDILVLAVLTHQFDDLSFIKRMKLRPLNRAITNARMLHSNFESALSAIRQTQTNAC